MAEPPIGDLADRLLSAKEKSGKTFDQIADELGFTNTYTTQLLLGQAQLKPDTLPKLKKAVPGISEADLETLSKAPFRGWDPEILKEPNVYRTYEAVTHYGNTLKLLINEKFGDGIMSAIDFYMDVGTTTGNNLSRGYIGPAGLDRHIKIFIFVKALILGDVIASKLRLRDPF